MSTFDPRSLRGTHEVKVWEPGRRILLARRWQWGAVVGLVIALFFAGLLVFAAVDTARAHHASVLVVLLLVLALGGPIVLAVVLAVRPHWTEIDWKRQRWRFERGGASTKMPMAEVREIQIVGRRVDMNDTRTDPDGSVSVRKLRPTYYCAVMVLHGNGAKTLREELCRTDFADDLESRWPLIGHFAEELARAVGQPCERIKEEN